MSIAVVRDTLLWCTVLNYALLVVWALLTLAPHDWLRRLWGRWYRVSPGAFDALNFGGIGLYKLLIIVFNLIPYIAIRIAAG